MPGIIPGMSEIQSHKTCTYPFHLSRKSNTLALCYSQTMERVSSLPEPAEEHDIVASRKSRRRPPSSKSWVNSISTRTDQIRIRFPQDSIGVRRQSSSSFAEHQRHTRKEELDPDEKHRRTELLLEDHVDMLESEISKLRRELDRLKLQIQGSAPLSPKRGSSVNCDGAITPVGEKSLKKKKPREKSTDTEATETTKQQKTETIKRKGERHQKRQSMPRGQGDSKLRPSRSDGRDRLHDLLVFASSS